MAIIGQDSGSYTPQDVERKRQWAKILLQGQQPAREPFGALAQGLRGAMAGWNDYEAGKIEGDKRAALGAELKNGDWQGVMGSEWASPQMLAMASLMQGREWEVGDRQEQWAREDARAAAAASAAAAAAAQPDYGFTFAPDGTLIRTDETSGAFTPMGQFADPEGDATAPSGYRTTPEGNLTFIPGGPADPANAGAKPPTDADVRAAKLAGVIQGDKELLLGENGIYDKLADPWSQAVGAEVGVGGVGVGRPGMALTSPDYQSATSALTNIAQSYLYAISGQAAPAGEVAKIIESVTPKFGENETSVKNKKARLASYIEAIEASKYDVPTGGAPASGGWSVIGVE